MFNFNHLYYFYITTRSDSLTIAAKHLRISQPSLSSQLKDLQNFLGLKLFHKVGRGNELTDEGYLLSGFCRRMFDISEELEELLNEKILEASRRLYIGISNEIDKSFVVEVVSDFLSKQSKARLPRVNMISGSYEQLIEQLRFRELDIILTEKTTSHPDLVSLVSIESPVLLVQNKNSSIQQARAESKQVKKNKYTKKSLHHLVGGKEAKWIMPSSRSKLRFETDKFFELHFLKGRIVFESDMIASLVRSVEDGLGSAFLPLFYLKKSLQTKSVKIIGSKDGYWKYSLWLGFHHKSVNDQLLLAFAKAFTEVGKV